MNKNRLLRKRQKREAKRKAAQLRARRRTISQATERQVFDAREQRRLAVEAAAAQGTALVPDQYDKDAAPVVAESA